MSEAKTNLLPPPPTIRLYELKCSSLLTFFFPLPSKKKEETLIVEVRSGLEITNPIWEIWGTMRGDEKKGEEK